MWTYNYNHQTELYHHGIKGQKWGVQNGPPYPLSYTDYTRAEKRHLQNLKSLKKNAKRDRNVSKKEFERVDSVRTKKAFYRFSKDEAKRDYINFVDALAAQKYSEMIKNHQDVTTFRSASRDEKRGKATYVIDGKRYVGKYSEILFNSKKTNLDEPFEQIVKYGNKEQLIYVDLQL